MTDRVEEYKARLLEVAKEKPEALVEMYMHLRKELHQPPEGWFVFGSHVDQIVQLDFWGQDEDGLPLWERPITRGTP